MPIWTAAGGPWRGVRRGRKRQAERSPLSSPLRWRLARSTRPSWSSPSSTCLSRNLAFIAALMDSGVEFIAVDNPHANKLTIHILAAVAQHERELIAQRTREALQAAKARGKKLGNPKLGAARKLASRGNKASAARYAANVLPVIRGIQGSGINSLRGIARALTARGIRDGSRRRMDASASN